MRMLERRIRNLERQQHQQQQRTPPPLEEPDARLAWALAQLWNRSSATPTPTQPQRLDESPYMIVLHWLQKGKSDPRLIAADLARRERR